MQKPNFYDEIDYVLTFIGEEGTTAKLPGYYRVTEKSQKSAKKFFHLTFHKSPGSDRH